MQHNLGAVDRGIRGALVAPTALGLAMTAEPGTSDHTCFLTVVAFMLLTALFGWCPAYSLMDTSTVAPVRPRY